jgi:uncharacterized membrane protein
LTIKNPIEWSGAQLVQAAHAVKYAGQSLHHIQDTIHSPAPVVRKIAYSDVWQSLREGFADFEAYRSDVVFLCITYVAVGLVLARFAFGSDLLPLLFPLASGFALIGPLAAVGLYEMSRQREQGFEANWRAAFHVLKAPSLGGLSVLGLALIAIFLLWLAAAWGIYQWTLGPAPVNSIPVFAHEVFSTTAGWTMIVVGVGVGFLFAVLAMSISIVSFPLLLDRDTGLDTAIGASMRAVRTNPGPMALWGLIVAGSLVLGSLPLFLGLVIVIPVLGHATWHLYRKLVAPA